MAESMLSSKDRANASVRSLPLVMMERANASIHVGNVSLSPSQGGNELQFAISQKIGVPPRHVTSFLVRDRQSRIPLDENTDLSIVLRETGDWYVLAKVPVWRARNGRNRRCRGRRAKGNNGFVAENPKPLPEQIVLRRNNPVHMPLVHYLLHRPVIMMPVSEMWTPYADQTWRRDESSRTVCAACEAAEDLGVEAAFHRCIKDVVVQAGSLVRSPVGPIERPSRNRVEAY